MSTDLAMQRRGGTIPTGYTTPYPPLRIIANVYYVGMSDLAAYLITTPQGHILINTGLVESVPLIRANIEQLGFKVSDIKLLLATHGHWDHVAGMAELKSLTGAQMLMHDADAPMLEDGGNTDYRFPRDQARGMLYEPVKVDRRLKDGDRVRLGMMELTAHHHPGHTKGSTTFSFDVQEAGKPYRVLIANMGSINEGVKLLSTPGYPNIVDDYARTFRQQKALACDVFLASHAAQFGLHGKYKPGDPYKSDRFVDPNGYLAAVNRLERVYLDQLASERKVN
ncbi:MAG: subclass B3 metallo-beta-lactamase [Vicinamibacterales bacterium]